jgi:hypothetical protein
MSNREIIVAKLTALLARSNEDAFVVFEHASSGKFVQFAGSTSEPLLLDLPSQTLCKVEFDRAVAFFRRVGVAGEEHEVLDEPGGSVVGRRFSFTYSPGTVEEAADVAVGVFREIFDFADGFEMVVREN